MERWERTAYSTSIIITRPIPNYNCTIMRNTFVFFRKIVPIIIFFCFAGKQAFSQKESYIQSLSGVIKPKDVCITVDEKFSDHQLWSTIKKNVMVQNLITFELRFDTTVLITPKAFDCELIADIEYKDSAQQVKTINDVKLTLHYDTAKGKPFKGIAYYKFSGGHEVKVIVKSISSKQIDVAKAGFLRLKNQILIDRTYKQRAGDKTATLTIKFSNGASKTANK